MLTEQQRAARREGIGGSDAAVILGVSKWKTPYELWCEKTQKLDPRDDPERLRPVRKELAWGNRLEAVILDAFQEERGIAVTSRDVQIAHPKHSFILGSLDGLAEDGCPVEAKSAGRGDDWGDSGSDEIPDYYFPQVQHYIGLYPEAAGAHVAVLIGGNDLRTYFVPRDHEFIHDLYLLERDFWVNQVQAGVAPEPTSLPGMIHKFRYDDGSAVECDEDVAQLVANIKAMQIQRKDLEKAEEALELAVMATVGPAQVITHLGRPIATWKTRNGVKRFDSRGFSAAHPELHQQFMRQGEPSRPFQVK